MDGDNDMAWIKLTHLLNKERKPLYVNTDQIARIIESSGGAPGYATTITLTNREQDVCETVSEVMNLINPAQS
jgi:hypothetical protein